MIYTKKYSQMRFSFIYNENNQLEFTVTDNEVIRIYNLINGSNYNIYLLENKLDTHSASIMANNMIICNDYNKMDINLGKMIRSVYTYKTPQFNDK